MVQVTLTPVQNALPSYDVGGELGRGAMGVVLAGRHRQLERDVAIKQLPAAFASDEEVRHRFGQEAKTLAALAHPHIVPVYDYVEREGLCLLVMEALPGGTLWDRFTGEGVTMATACTAVLATCAGLQFAHERGVLHRDVKPDNLMFAADRTLKITDFGIAQVFGGEETVTTIDGAVIGTPAYMAPEQAEGHSCGPPADVYATGTVLYELLSGTLPFSLEGGSFEVLERRVHEEPQELLEVAPNVPIPLAEVTMRAIARDPDDRYSTAEAFGIAIARGGDRIVRHGLARTGRHHPRRTRADHDRRRARHAGRGRRRWPRRCGGDGSRDDDRRPGWAGPAGCAAAACGPLPCTAAVSASTSCAPRTWSASTTSSSRRSRRVSRSRSRRCSSCCSRS